MSLDRTELAARCLAASESLRVLAEGLSASSPVKCEAPRPEWVRITGPASAEYVTVGKAYRVVERNDMRGGRPMIINDAGREWWCAGPGERGDGTLPNWVPCAAPSSPPSCDAPEPPATYVPKVGDRVRVISTKATRVGPQTGAVVVINSHAAWPGGFSCHDGKRSWGFDADELVYDGPASASERAAAGLPPAEATATDDGDECIAWLRREGWAISSNAIAAWNEATRRARAAAPTATRSVDREGLAEAIKKAVDDWADDDSDDPVERTESQVAADAAIAYFKNGGVA